MRSLQSPIGMTPLVLWGVVPIALGIRELTRGIETGFTWQWIGESAPVVYCLVAWALAVLAVGRPRGRLAALVPFFLVPGLLLGIFGCCSVAYHLLPGGGFYIPDVVARGNLWMFALFHLVYLAVFPPMLYFCGFVIGKTAVQWRIGQTDG